MFKGAPSKQQLALLQKRGVVFWSPIVTRAAIVATVFSILYLSVNAGVGVLQPPGVVDPVVWLRAQSEDVLRLLGGLAVGALAVGFVVSVVQTKGAFGPAVLAQRKKLDRPGTNPVGVVVGLFMTAAVSTALFYLGTPRLLGGLQDGAGGAAMYGALGLLCKLVVVASVVLAILAWMITRILFLFAHRERTGRDRD